jgi:hypothetical protein
MVISRALTINITLVEIIIYDFNFPISHDTEAAFPESEDVIVLLGGE